MNALLFCFHWYKKCKNPPRNIRDVVQNKVARFLWPTVYIVCLVIGHYSVSVAVGLSLVVPLMNADKK